VPEENHTSEPDPCLQTDTASVLHEAAACIRSLHEQIQVRGTHALHFPLRVTLAHCHYRYIEQQYRSELSVYVLLQILAAPLPGVSCSSPSSQDTGEEPATSLRRQGLCVAPLSAAVASLVCDNARGHGHNRTDLGAGAFFGAL
jgi:hypothetical protein